MREIVLEGDLTEEQRTRLIEIAERCPVHGTLQQGARVSTAEVGELGELRGVEEAASMHRT